MGEQLECMELCLGMDNKPAGSSWVRIRGQTNMVDILVGACCEEFDQEEVD